jgi:hypothetical protein
LVSLSAGLGALESELKSVERRFCVALLFRQALYLRFREHRAQRSSGAAEMRGRQLRLSRRRAIAL